MSNIACGGTSMFSRARTASTACSRQRAVLPVVHLPGGQVVPHQPDAEGEEDEKPDVADGGALHHADDTEPDHHGQPAPEGPLVAALSPWVEARQVGDVDLDRAEHPTAGLRAVCRRPQRRRGGDAVAERGPLDGELRADPQVDAIDLVGAGGREEHLGGVRVRVVVGLHPEDDPAVVVQHGLLRAAGDDAVEGLGGGHDVLLLGSGHGGAQPPRAGA